MCFLISELTKRIEAFMILFLYRDIDFIKPLLSADETNSRQSGEWFYRPTTYGSSDAEFSNSYVSWGHHQDLPLSKSQRC